MLIGYARISKFEQNIDLQKDALGQRGCKKIIVDQVSGVSSNREGLARLMEILRAGDTLVVWRPDRLGRSLKHLIQLIGELELKGISFQSLQESIDTNSSSGKLIFHIFGALAEFERNLIIERTKAGLNAARARGRKGGRPKALNEHKREIAKNLYKERVHTIKEICQIMEISKPTLYAYLRENSESKC